MTEPMAYVGYCPTCHAICAAAVDEPQYAPRTAKFVAQMIRDGLRVDRATCAAVRSGVWCNCLPKSRKRRAKAAQESLPLPGAA